MKDKVIKISITGPESTGKSELTRWLSSHYNEPFADEYARHYLSRTAGKYTFEDLEEICRGQIILEQKAMEKANQICFFDTDMLVLKIWSEYRFGKTPKIINESFLSRQHDFYLLCNNDLPWEADFLRESPNEKERQLLFSIYQKHLVEMKANYFIVSGTGKERFGYALKAVESFLKKDF